MAWAGGGKWVHGPAGGSLFYGVVCVWLAQSSSDKAFPGAAPFPSEPYLYFPCWPTRVLPSSSLGWICSCCNGRRPGWTWGSRVICRLGGSPCPHSWAHRQSLSRFPWRFLCPGSQNLVVGPRLQSRVLVLDPLPAILLQDWVWPSRPSALSTAARVQRVKFQT